MSMETVNLSKYLKEYKELTLELIEEVKKEGDLEPLLNKREEILNLIRDMNFDKEEIKRIGNSLNLLQLEEEFHMSVKKEQVRIKQEIAKLKNGHKVNQNYNSIDSVRNIFNKTI